MRIHERRAPIQRALDQLFALGIETASRIVEHQALRLRDDCAGNREALLLIA